MDDKEIRILVNKTFIKYAKKHQLLPDEFYDELMQTLKAIQVQVKVKPANGGLWLELDDYVPIDIDKVKRERDKIYNIPNEGWQQIEPDLETINDITNPYTLRHYLLNHLPVCAIKILDESRLSV